MLTRTPSRKGTQYTFTSENSPLVLRRSRTVSRVCTSMMSPMAIPAIERMVSSSVRALSSTRMSRITSPMAKAARGSARASAIPIRQANLRMLPVYNVGPPWRGVRCVIWSAGVGRRLAQATCRRDTARWLLAGTSSLPL
jgi:hypothetical protein